MTLSDFELLEIFTEDGRRLGRVFDLRIHGRPTTRERSDTASIDAIVFGRLGLLERLGLRPATSRTLPWDCVVAIGEGRLVVRSSAA